MLLFFNVFSLFFEHLHLKNHHSLNAIGQSVVAVLVTEYYTHYNIAIIMYHSNRKSPDMAALDPSLILSVATSHTPDSDRVDYSVFHMFLLKYKACFNVSYFRIYVSNNYDAQMSAMVISSEGGK